MVRRTNTGLATAGGGTGPQGPIGPAGPSSAPGGASTNVQYNLGSTFAGDSGLVWDHTFKTLAIGNGISFGTPDVGIQINAVLALGNDVFITMKSTNFGASYLQGIDGTDGLASFDGDIPLWIQAIGFNDDINPVAQPFIGERFEVDGNPTATQVPGRIIWEVRGTADGLVERMRLSSTGILTLAGLPVGTQAAHVDPATATPQQICNALIASKEMAP